jgi:hypothetical protein
MTSMTQSRPSGGYLERPAPSGLADVIEIILDKGLVIDIYVRVSLVGIELLTIDARIVIASVDTYLRFAEATNRLDLYEHGGKDLPELFDSLQEGGAKHKTKGALSGAMDKVSGALGSDDDENDDDDEGRNGQRPRRRSSSGSSGNGRARQPATRRRRSGGDDE